MFSKTIDYLDFDGNPQKETLYFHMSKLELVDMGFEMGDDFEAKIKRIIATEDKKELIDLFKDLLLRSYGKKSEDGKRFIKSDQLREEALQSDAFSELFMALAQSSDEAIRFVNALVPNDGKGNILKTAEVVSVDDARLTIPREEKLHDAAKAIYAETTEADLQNMTLEELKALLTAKK